jgi:hypothetical protein
MLTPAVLYEANQTKEATLCREKKTLIDGFSFPSNNMFL